jgi:hypothetical protein
MSSELLMVCLSILKLNNGPANDQVLSLLSGIKLWRIKETITGKTGIVNSLIRRFCTFPCPLTQDRTDLV